MVQYISNIFIHYTRQHDNNNNANMSTLVCIYGRFLKFISEYVSEHVGASIDTLIADDALKSSKLASESCLCSFSEIEHLMQILWRIIFACYTSYYLDGIHCES